MTGDELAESVGRFLRDVALGAADIGRIGRVVSGTDDLVPFRQIVPRASAKLAFVVGTSASRKIFFNFRGATTSNVVARLDVDAEIAAAPDEPVAGAGATSFAAAAWPGLIAVGANAATIELPDRRRATLERDRRGRLRATVDGLAISPANDLGGFAWFLRQVVASLVDAEARTRAAPPRACDAPDHATLAPLASAILAGAVRAADAVGSVVVEADDPRDAMRYALARLEGAMRLQLGADGHLVERGGAAAVHDVAAAMALMGDRLELRAWPGGGADDDERDAIAATLRGRSVIGRLHEATGVETADLAAMLDEPAGSVRAVQIDDAESWIVSLRGRIDGRAGECLATIVFTTPPTGGSSEIHRVPLGLKSYDGRTWWTSASEADDTSAVEAWLLRLIETLGLVRAIAPVAPPPSELRAAAGER